MKYKRNKKTTLNGSLNIFIAEQSYSVAKYTGLSNKNTTERMGF